MSYVVTNLTVEWGRTGDLTVTVGNLGSSGLNAFNDIRFTAKHDLEDSDGAAIISKRLGNGITITTVGNATTNGVLTIALAPADTASLPAGYTSALTYDVSVYDSSGNGYTVAKGTLSVEGTVTQAIS